MGYSKSYIPLECNPNLFTQLIHKLGVSSSLAFHDVLSIDDPDLLAFTPRPALALVLVFPTSTIYEEQKAREEASTEIYQGSGEGESVMWFKQTIHNACGLYGILHAVSNGEARKAIVPKSPLADFHQSCLPLTPVERARVLESSDAIETAYRAIALQGDSEVPESAEDEVDYHYVCFVKSQINQHLYELDGDRNGPIDRGFFGADQDVMAGNGLDVIREYIQREKGGNPNFGLLALGPA